MNLHLANIFKTHSGKWLTSKKVRDLMYQECGFELPCSEFQRVFLEFRDQFEYEGKRVLHIKINGLHKYSLSNNKYFILKHNLLLNREQAIREKRKITA